MSQPMKYRKKVVDIEAMQISADNNNVQVDGEESFLDPNRRDIALASGWMLGNGFRDFKVHGDGPFGIAMKALQGIMVAHPGDYIIKGARDEFYPCKRASFEANYEEAN